jgi:circadian clock protein KaiB
MAVKSKHTKHSMRRLDKIANARYVLRLYVAGLTPRSAAVIQRVSEFCDKHLSNRYELKIIDIYRNPALAKADQIFAVPTLVKRLPPPLRRRIGDMHRDDKLLFGLDLAPSLPVAA